MADQQYLEFKIGPLQGQQSVVCVFDALDIFPKYNIFNVIK